MKKWKKIAGLAFASLLIVGCSGGSSSSSSGAITPSSSDPLSSSSGEAAGTLADLADEIAYSAGKYSSVTASSLLSSAKAADPSLNENKTATYADMILLSYLAFKDSLGQRVGARIYEWYLNGENPSFSTYDASSIYSTAFRFFSDAGLLEANKYGTSFDASQTLSGTEFYKFIQHIHFYISGSAQDDFFGYANREQRMETVEGYGPNDSLYKTNLSKMEAYIAWVTEYIAKVPAAQYVNESIRAVGESSLFKEALLRYDSASSVAELYSLLVKDIKERGYSPLYETVNINMEYKSGGFVIYPTLSTHDASGESEEYAEGGARREIAISSSAPFFSSLLGNASKGQALASQYADYLHLFLQEKEKHPDYSDESYFIDDPSQKIGSLNATFGELASALGLSDATNLCLSSQKAGLSFFNLFKDENLSALKGLCAYLIMNHYKVLLPDTELFNQGIISSSITGSKFSNSSFLRNHLYPLYSGNLVNYYATTEEYASNLSLLEGLSVTLKETMKEKFTSSTWLSEEGKTKALQKLENMKSVILAKQDNGETLQYVAPDYGALASGKTAFEYVYQYDLSMWKKYSSAFSLTGDAAKYGLAAVTFDPLTINAFYSPSGNFFVLLPGFMFAIGNPVNLTQEELVASYGWIMAHEMGHGYDTNGFLFNNQGVHDPSYMPSADQNAFYALTERYRLYLSSQEILADIYSDPDFILTEAVADNIGLSVALSAGLKKENFSAEKFFLSCAKNFGGQVSRYSALQNSTIDSHPVARARINAPFRNFSIFLETFGVKERDFMYLAPEERVLLY